MPRRILPPWPRKSISFSSLQTLSLTGQRGTTPETDPVNPLSVYGETKVAAEEIVLRNPRHLVLRTSLNSGATPDGSSLQRANARKLGAEGKTVKLFHDEFRCPISAAVTARALWELAARGAGAFIIWLARNDYPACKSASCSPPAIRNWPPGSKAVPCANTWARPARLIPP